MGKKKAFLKTAHLFSGTNNQFRMKFNRTKHHILNAKTKGTKGHPVLSKGIAYAKRKDDWVKTQLSTKKANRFIDKRVFDPSMSLEDQATARFIRERQKKEKKNKFNLNDDEELTHKGKPLQDAQDSDGMESEEEEGALSAQFVSKAHFGGFASDANTESTKSYKEIVKDLIKEDKKKKYEEQLEKEKYLELQEMADKEWKEIHKMNVFSNSSATSKKVLKQKPAVHETRDEYDVLKAELKFQARGISATRTKTPEEIAKIEEEKRIKLEKERMKRMAVPLNKNIVHESADALGNDFDYLFDAEENENEDNSGDDNTSDIDNDESMVNDDNENDKSIIPLDFETFRNETEDCDPDQLYDIVENILKTTIRSKNKKVRSDLINFFSILIKYALFCCEEESSGVEKASVLLPHLHKLAEAEPRETGKKFLEYMDEEQELFQNCKKHIKGYKSDYPRLQLLMILRFAGLIYSVSDRIHPIGLPAMDLMSDIFTSKYINTHSNIVSRLLVSDILLNYIKDSKRFFPEVINFLDSILKLAIPEKTDTSKINKFSLVLNEKLNSEDIIKLNVYERKKLSSDSDKIAIISEVFNHLNQYAKLYTHNILCFKAVFMPSIDLCLQLQTDYYPPRLQESIKAFTEFVQNKNSILKHLTFPTTKPKPLKMFEPAYESKFSKNKDDINKKRKAIKSVQQKIKKEERCMMREVRKDSQMVSAENLKKKIELDNERKRKVKEIYSQLAEQEGEYKKMMKKKS